jgi:hypothetical protein
MPSYVRVRGEEQAAYHIDFHLKDNPNWAVIHVCALVERSGCADGSF